MQIAHNIKITVHAKEDENQDNIENKLFSLLPLTKKELKKEKISISRETVEIFENKNMMILTLYITKKKYANLILNNIIKKLSKKDITFLKDTIETRLDKRLYFFFRLDKQKFIKNNKYILTDKGDCIHFKFCIQAYPKKREIAIKTIEKYLNEIQ